MKSFKAIALIFTILISLFLSVAHAEISLTPQFYEPLGPWESSNFEANGYWTTNNGGYLSQNCFVEGEHSWFTSGGGDYYMWRWVSSNMINAIAGKTVMFSFRFYPESVVSDGSQNNARAEIYYEYTTSGGGGCPYVSAWNGLNYVLDNNLMPSSESTASDATDYYLLQQPLVPNYEGLHSLLLSEFEEEQSFFDRVQLLAVDHPSNVSVAVSPMGEILTYINPSSPASAIDDNNQNVKKLLSSIDGNFYEGYSGSYITLNFGDMDVSQGAKLVLRADVVYKLSIYIQVQDSRGKWDTVATVIPRINWATEIIDMSKYLPDAKGNLKVRLYFTANHKLDFVGLDTSPQAAINIQQAELISAKHSKSADPTVYGASKVSDVKSKILYDDGAYVELRPSEQIKLAFSLLGVSANLVRDFIFVSKGRYSTLPLGTLIDPTVHGVWVASTELKWHNTYVTATLPSTTTAVKAIIHGTPDFRAYVDVATLTIFDYVSASSSTYGKLTLGTNLYEWRKTTGFDPDGEIKLVPALYAEVSSGSYGIRAIQIKVEPLPNDGSSTSQDGFLNVYYTSQGNDEGYEIDPAMTEEIQTRNLETAAIIIGFGTAVLLGWGIPLIFGTAAIADSQFLGVFARATASTVIARVATYLLHTYRSDPNDPHAQKGTDYFTLERWDYPTWINEKFVGPQPWFVSSASGQYSMEWSIRTWTSSSFQIRITAFVNWGEIIYHPGNIHDHWTLDDRGWSEVSQTITIYA